MKKLSILIVSILGLISCTQDDISEDQMKTEALKTNELDKITICHKDMETITISRNALQAHLDHGDKIGPCGSTYVPDDNFEAFLEANGMGDGVENNDFVFTANIENVLKLDMVDIGIFDLTGIQDFINLKRLNCPLNKIGSIDLSGLLNLNYLRVNNNLITSLDVSQLNNLEFLFANNNLLEELVLNPNSNVPLKSIFCQNNGLVSLDLSNFKQLNKVRLDNNKLISVNLKNEFNADISTLDSRNNSSALLIKVDDPVSANAGLSPYDIWKKDVSASYN